MSSELLPARERIVEQLIPLVDRAGAAILTVYAGADLGVTRKADASPVTQADLVADRLITEGLAAAWPAIPILSEEGENGFVPGVTPPLYWAVDPLDGTKEFIGRNGEFTVNIGLIEQGRSVLGVVAAPALDLLYVGGEGVPPRRRHRGVWQSIQAGEGPRARSARDAVRVAVSRSHPSPDTARWLERYPQTAARAIGSSLKFCLIASGEMEVYPKFGATCIWDTAAAQAVLEAAGGRVMTPDGAPLRYPDPTRVKNPDFIAASGEW